MHLDEIFNSQKIWPADYYECQEYAKKSGYKYLSFNGIIYNVNDITMENPICNDTDIVNKSTDIEMPNISVDHQTFIDNTEEGRISTIPNINRSSVYDIRNFIAKDDELTRLYISNPYFHSSIITAINSNMSVQDTLVYALKVAYNLKDAVK